MRKNVFERSQVTLAFSFGRKNVGYNSCQESRAANIPERIATKRVSFAFEQRTREQGLLGDTVVRNFVQVEWIKSVWSQGDFAERVNGDDLAKLVPSPCSNRGGGTSLGSTTMTEPG